MSDDDESRGMLAIMGVERNITIFEKFYFIIIDDSPLFEFKEFPDIPLIFSPDLSKRDGTTLVNNANFCSLEISNNTTSPKYRSYISRNGSNIGS